MRPSGIRARRIGQDIADPELHPRSSIELRGGVLDRSGIEGDDRAGLCLDLPPTLRSSDRGRSEDGDSGGCSAGGEALVQ